MRSNKKTGFMIVFVVLILSFVVMSCGEKKPGGFMPTPEVAFVTIQVRPVVTTTELSGRTSANLIAEVRPQVSGIIQKRFFTEGSEVKAGQVLFQIDPALYQATLARVEANLTALELKVRRMRELLADKAVSQQEYDDVAAALKQLQAEVQSASINLKYTTITAPISGRIGKSNVTAGALVTAHQPLALATIQQMDPMYVDVTQSTADILKLRRQMQEGQLVRSGQSRQEVKLIMDDGTEYPLKGTMQFQDISVDPTTGSVILRIVFPNPDHILMPGMFVRAAVQEGIHKNAILVPQQAVSRDPKGSPLVLIVDKDGKVQQKPLTLDRAIGSEWLVSSGLEPGDKVIVEGMLKVKPGIPVKAVPFEPGEKSSGKTENAKPAKTN